MNESAVEAWMAEAVRQRARAFADQLRACAHGGIPVPNLEWTVADLGQHVACLPAFWEDQHAHGADFQRPDDFAACSDAARAHITETEPNHLAAQIERELDDYLELLAAGDGQRWLYGVPTTASNMCGLALNELVLHGRDLAAVTGADKPTFERREANLAVDASMVTTAFFVDEAKARARPDGIYHLRFRGGHHYTWTKRGGELVVEQGRPERADAHLNADPAVFLMTALGRYGQIRAALTGGMLAYGRRPWRFFGLGTVMSDGV